MSTKVLSIIIPMYNMENYIGKCLQSLLDIPTECLESIDIIVVNDGSKDQSLRIATSYQKKYPEVIRVIDKENGNYGSCINAGLAKALGTYVKVLDSDDYFSSVGLSAILEKISSIPVMDMIANSTSKCKITKCFCKSTPLVLRNLISFLVSH